MPSRYICCWRSVSSLNWTGLQAVIHEKFGDGIMSMIDCKVHVEKKPDPKGDRVVLTFEYVWPHVPIKNNLLIFSQWKVLTLCYMVILCPMNETTLSTFPCMRHLSQLKSSSHTNKYSASVKRSCLIFSFKSTSLSCQWHDSSASTSSYLCLLIDFIHSCCYRCNPMRTAIRSMPWSL